MLNRFPGIVRSFKRWNREFRRSMHKLTNPAAVRPTPDEIRDTPNIDKSAKKDLSQDGALASAMSLLPKRYQAFFKPVITMPAELNLQESTTKIHRLMSVGELSQIINTNTVGSDPGIPSIYSLKKRSHLNIPEHIQENNSKLLLSFASDPWSAAAYAGVNFMPNVYALVTSALPPVFTVPSTHAILDHSPFDIYHNYYRLQEMHISAESGSKYVPPINSSILCQSQKEVDMLINTPNGKCDFRPKAVEMLVNAHFIFGGFKTYSFVSHPAPIQFKPLQRDWAIEALCPIDELNYSRMLESARNQGLIPPGSRPLTVDDAVVIFSEFAQIFPASYNISHDHIHILKYVPDTYPIGSRQVVQFMIKEHSLFRDRHSPLLISSQHEYQEYSSEKIHRPRME